MTIYTRMGGIATINRNCGQYHPPYLPKGTQLSLVLVDILGLGNPRYKWAETLKADDGWNEIKAAIDAAPRMRLNKKELAAAFREAE